MLIPLSWLKEYVDIKIPFAKLAQRMSEVGLTIEVWHKDGEDIIFDPEITPNRPDWMSVTGIAREVAAATNSKLEKPARMATPSVAGGPKTKLELNYKDDPELCPRTSRILVKNVKVKPSPDWLQKRILQIGLRPINNLVDITNYVLWMYGNPLHVFDYDQIRGHSMTPSLSRGGEDFRSLDGTHYKLPPGAIVIKDLGRIIDLLPLKGGQNTAVSTNTKNILLHSIVCDPVLTRRTSQALGLRSDSSAVSERGVDPNGTTRACLKALEMILEIAGGEAASELMEIPKEPLPNWKVAVTHQQIENILGIKVSPKKVKAIWESLGLEVKGDYEVTIPTFRNDLHLEEDLIEEVGRIIGYNHFPKTLPTGSLPTQKIAYAHDYDFDFEIKQILKGAGYSEIYTYSLVCENQLTKLGINPAKTLRVDNPISKEYEYLRPTIFGNLLDAVKINQAFFSNIKLFEFGKEYKGESLDKTREEYWIWGVTFGNKFYESKGDLVRILDSLGIDYIFRPSVKEDDIEWGHPGRTATIETKDKEYLGFVGEVHPSFLDKWGIKDRAVSWELKYEVLKKYANLNKKYSPIPKFPPIIEDVTLNIPQNILYGEVIEKIKAASKLIAEVTLVTVLDRNFTFRITYLDKNKNLTDKDVAPVRKKLKELLKG